MSIYNDVFLIDEQLRALQDAVEGNENQEEVERLLRETREIVLNEGLEKLCKVRQNRLAEIEALKKEEDRLKAKRKSLENSTDGLEGYMADVFKLTGEAKATYGTFTLSFRKSTKCIINEDLFADERFQTIQEIKTIDKMAVKKALTAGETITGASLEECQNLQIK